MDMKTMYDGLRNAPWDDLACNKCGGTGYLMVGCCSGFECGCMGLPVGLGDCECNNKASDEQIKEWAEVK